MANNPLGQYGYPSQKQITNQARNLAAASVTPASQIRRQYARSQTDASGFTQALISLLGGQQAQYNSAANDALSQQQAIDSAAASRLGGVAPQYQGAQIATGALGDSAAARQISQGEALKGYGAQQPGIAASRGALAQLGLTNAMQDALAQRRTQLQQAFQQALPQVQQNALGMATAAANIDQNRQQLAYQYASLAQNQAQFNIREADARRAQAAAAAAAAAKANTGPSGQTLSPIDPTTHYSTSENSKYAKIAGSFFTPSSSVNQSQPNSKGGTTSQTVKTYQNPAPLQGMNFQDTLNAMMQQGVPQDLAYYYASGLYDQYANARSAYADAARIRRLNGQSVPSFSAFKTSNLWAQAQRAYQSYSTYAFGIEGMVPHGHSGRYKHRG